EHREEGNGSTGKEKEREERKEKSSFCQSGRSRLWSLILSFCSLLSLLSAVALFLLPKRNLKHEKRSNNNRKKKILDTHTHTHTRTHKWVSLYISRDLYLCIFTHTDTHTERETHFTWPSVN